MQANSWLYTVWFGTNRKPNDPDNLEKGGSAHRDNRVHYGTCKVSIPKSHEFGSIGASWWRQWFRRSDDRLTVVERRGANPNDFWRDVAAALQTGGVDDRQGLVFLHGYNSSFDEAAIRAAQIGFDLKVPGVTAFFSWPSRGALVVCQTWIGG
jgi:esterase/lipase superfamily enzyme